MRERGGVREVEGKRGSERVRGERYVGEGKIGREREQGVLGCLRAEGALLSLLSRHKFALSVCLCVHLLITRELEMVAEIWL